MCRGSFSWLLLAAALGLAACVDADNATPTQRGSIMPGAGSAAPRGGAGGTSVTPPAGMAGRAAPPPPAPSAGMAAPTPMAGSSAPATAGMSGTQGGAGGMGMMAAGGSSGTAGASAGGAGGAGGTATGPKFSEVYPILMMRCAACHGAAGGVMLGTKDQAYMSLMSGMSRMGACMGMKIVTPNMPDASVLIQALKATGCRMNRPMPNVGARVADADIKKISDWIMAGAKND